MRQGLQKRIEQDPESDVFFWDGEVCVRSTAITVGNPPQNTISIHNLNGVSVSKGHSSILGMLACLIVLLFFWFLGFSTIKSSPWVGGFLLILSAWPAWLMARPAPWEVLLKQGGMLADEIFTSRSEKWAKLFCDAVSQAIIQRKTGGSGGQPVAVEAIFPDPVLTRN